VADGAALRDDTHLFTPRNAYRMGGGGFRGGRGETAAGQNPPNGAVIYYSLKEKPKGELTLEFLDNSGKLIRKISSKEEKKPPEEHAEEEEDSPRPPPGADRAPIEKGLNRFVWDMRHPDASKFPGMIFWAGTVRGPLVVPGAYQVRLTVNGKSQTQSFEVKKDPRLSTTPQEFASQLALALQIRDKLTTINDDIVHIRDIRKQLDGYIERVKDQKVVDAAKALSKKFTEVEEALYQTKNRANEDPLNFPIRLNNKLAHLLGVVESSDNAPTTQTGKVFEDLASQTNIQLRKLDQVMKADLAAFNKLVREENIPAVVEP